MKHLAKNVYLKRDGEYSFELMRKTFVKEGKHAGKERYITLGYFSNMERVLNKLKDLGYEEWINGDVEACRTFINTAVDNAIESLKV